MNKIRIIEGGILTDYRGKLSHINGIGMSEVKRSYIFHHDNTEINLYMHAHQHKKWFYYIKSSFTTAFVKIYNRESPSKE